MIRLSPLRLRDKHIHIKRDSELLKTIYREVEQHLVADTKKFKLAIGFKFTVYFPLSLFSYYLLFMVKNPLVFILVFVLYGFILLLFAFNFSHDFSHNTIFKSKRLNNFCFTAIYTLVGAHAQAWKHRHINSHHFAPNVEDYDSDLQITKLIRVIPDSTHLWFHRYQHLYAPFVYTTYSLFWVFVKDFVILFSIDEYSNKKDLKYHLSFWLQKIIYVSIALILPLLFSYQEGYVVLVGFLLMHIFQSLFLLFTFFMTHHVEKTEYPRTDTTGYINTSWLMNQIRSSNDMHPFSKVANFILGGFNNHIAHHLFPHLHHIHYPEVNRVLYALLKSNNIEPNQTTYWGGIKSHLMLLRRMSKE